MASYLSAPGPFPHESTLDEITAIFAEHAPVNSVRMRRHLTSKDFRGSVFVEFATPEDAQKVSSDNLQVMGSLLRVLDEDVSLTQEAAPPPESSGSAFCDAWL